MYSSRTNLIIGFHGCDKSVRDSLLKNPNQIKKSENSYDWLGHGMYFWENNHKRALKFAKDKKIRGKIQKPTVIGAVISLGNCLDLTDSESIETIKTYYDLMVSDYKATEQELPQNKNVGTNTDLLIRELDCVTIEYMHQKIKEEKLENNHLKHFDSVKGVFIEGKPIFDGSGIYAKTHIQICIRNSNCIKGFFLPRKEISFLG